MYINNSDEKTNCLKLLYKSKKCSNISQQSRIKPKRNENLISFYHILITKSIMYQVGCSYKIKQKKRFIKY